MMFLLHVNYTMYEEWSSRLAVVVVGGQWSGFEIGDLGFEI